MGRKPNTETRRAQIVEALLQEMAAVGYERASTKAIAARAGLAPGLVHYHFKNKEEILLDLIDRLIADAELRSAQAVEEVVGADAKLAAYVDARVGFGPRADEGQVRAWAIVIAEGMTQAAVRERLSRWLAGDQAKLRRWFTACGAEQPAQLAATLLATILGSFSLRALDVSGIPQGYARAQLLAWLRGVVPATAARRRASSSRSPG
jgi:TetR/AcrR family transcriptional repressor of bet genes